MMGSFRIPHPIGVVDLLIDDGGRRGGQRPTELGVGPGSARTVPSSRPASGLLRNEDSAAAEDPGTLSLYARSMLNFTSLEVSGWPLWNAQVVVEGAGVGGRRGEQAVPSSIRLEDRASGIGRHQPLKHVEREHRRGGVCDRRRIGDPDRDRSTSP